MNHCTAYIWSGNEAVRWHFLYNGGIAIVLHGKSECTVIFCSRSRLHTKRHFLLYHHRDGLKRKPFFQKIHQDRSRDVVRKIGYNLYGGELLVLCQKGKIIDFQCIAVNEFKIILGGKSFFQDGNQLVIDFNCHNESCPLTKSLRKSSDSGTDFNNQVVLIDFGKA